MSPQYLIISILLLFNSFLFADGKLDKIYKNNELKVCIWTQYYGISYLDNRTQKLIGIDSDLAKELAQELGVKLKYIQSSFPSLVEDINSNKCDIAMFAIGNTKDRRKKIRFTSAHLSSDIYAITTKTNQKIKNWNDIDKKGIIVGVAKGTYHYKVMEDKLKNAKLLISKSFKHRSQDLQSGRSDVFMTDYPYAKRMLAKTNWAKLITPLKTYHKTPYAWALSYGNEKFFNRVEKFIKDIKNDGRLKMYAKKNGLLPIVKLD